MNFGYHLARAEARAVCAWYRAMLPTFARRPPLEAKSIALEVYSYSGESSLPEQVASIRSFIKRAGRPRRFSVVSDGTHTRESIELLQRIDPAVAVLRLEEIVRPDLPAEMRPYLTTHPTGKQLALIMSLPVDQPAFYIDSDVLFFRGASDLEQIAASATAPATYLADCQLSADERLLRPNDQLNPPVNTGVLLLRQPLDWSLGLRRFLELQGEPNFFTNQTITHLAMHANGAVPFDRTRFVLQLDDQFVYPDLHAGTHLVLRHYVNPVRHKFWTSLWH